MSVANIVSALIFLRVKSLHNLMALRLKRLKQPKYLLGAIVGVAYFYFVFGRQRMPRSGPAGDLIGTADRAATVVAAGAVLLLVLMLLQWLWPRSRAALSFTEAEVAFLFPAPLSRKSLIHYRLISLHLGLIFSSLILAFISGRWGIAQPNFLLRLLGWWLLFSVMFLHTIGSSFALTSLLDRGMSTSKQKLSVWLVASTVLGITGIWTWHSWRAPSSTDIGGFSGLVSYLDSALSAGPLVVIFTPIKWILRPLASTNAHEFLLALAPALLVHIAHYGWVLSSEASFEEASIAHAQKRATQLAAMRSGNFRYSYKAKKARRPPFNLMASKRVELAFLWKNLLSTADYLAPRKMLATMVVTFAVSTWLAHSDHEVITRVVGMMATVMCGYALAFGAMVARQDLRSDLANIDILKVYPLRGWQVVLGQVLTPIVVLTMVLWLLLGVCAITLQPPENAAWLTSHVRVLGAIGIAILIPLICATQVLVLNAGVIVFPAWTSTNPSTGGGIDVMGQRILFFAAVFLSSIAALILPTIVAALLWLVSFLFIGKTMASVLAALLFVATFVAELGMATIWLGERFEKFDLSAEVRP